ncbi:MAG: aldehyde dehydrogenase family protein [Verrucomicrobiota bacterium]
MRSEFKSFVPKARSSEEFVNVVAPFDGAVIGKIEVANQVTVETALETAHELFQDHSRKLTTWERVAILEKTIELLEKHRDQFALESAREGGKPLVDSKVEVARALDGINLY